MKLNIVRRFENKERSCDIARTLNLSQSTVRTILIQSDKIKERSKRLASLAGTKFIRPRSITMEIMEKRLAEWLKHETERDTQVSLLSIQEKARELYKELRVELNDSEAKPFSASHGWLHRFKKRMKLFLPTLETRNVVDLDVVNDFPNVFKGVVEEGGYTPKQVFNLCEFNLFWRRSPAFRGDATTLNIVEKDCFIVLLGANVQGDCKLKPVTMYHSPNPTALKGYSRDHLPVIWRHNPKGTMLPNIFTDYFCNQLTSELKEYCFKQSIPFKILLVLESTPSHPQYLEDFSENIRVLFLPPNTGWLLQPMRIDVILLFRINYLHAILTKIVDDTYVGEDNVAGHYWQRFDVKDAVDAIGKAWLEIKQPYLNLIWHGMWPEQVKHMPAELTDKRSEVMMRTIALAETIGLKVDVFSLEQFTNPSREEMTQEELKRLKTADGGEDYAIRTLSADELREAFQHIKAGISILDERDHNRVRSYGVIRNLESALGVYKRMYKEKKKNSAQLNGINYVKMETPDESEIELGTFYVQVSKDENTSPAYSEHEDHDPIN